MRRAILCLFFFSSIQVVFSQTFFQKIRENEREGRITETQALYLNALRMMAPERLPEEYRQLPGPPLKSGFGLFARIRNRWEKFSPEQRTVLESFFYRPELPDSLISPSGLFKIHYTTTGWDAVSTEDVDGSGVPDYVEKVAASMDSVYTVEVGEMGLNPPPDDRGQDGPEWDVYIRNLNAYGVTWLEQQVPGNPKAWISYMEVENDFQEGGFYTHGVEAMRVTTAHEFFHMIQLGYNFRDGDIFLMEAGSTWMEDVVYDDVNDYYQYLGIQYSQNPNHRGFFDETNVPFNYSDDWREYGLSVWFHFLEKRTGGRQIVRDVWEQIVGYPAIKALDRTLLGRGSSFDEELALFYGWNYPTGSRADTSRFYPEGDAYPEIALDATIPYQGDTTITGNIQPTAARYFHFFRNDGISFTLIPTNVNRDSSGEFSLQLIEGENHSLYTNLGYGTLTRLVTQDEIGWKGVAVVEAPGQAASFIHFDEFKHEFSGSISGIVWEDVNGDGIMDNNEAGRFSHIALHLAEAGPDNSLGTSDDFAFPTRETGDDGKYVFNYLFPGLYRLQVDASTIPSGYLATMGSSPRDVVLAENENRSDVHFGYRPLDPEKLPASIPSPFIVSMYPELEIPFRIDASQRVKVTIFSSSGFKVKEEERYFETEGVHLFSWDGRDDRGECVPSGIYVYVVTSDSRILRKDKLAIVR